MRDWKYARLVFALGLPFGLALPAAFAADPRPSAAQIDAIFAPWSRSDSPGCALTALERGRVVYEHGYGMADLSHDVAIAPGTPFDVGSVSKQFTAAALVLLAEQGKLSLADDVHQYLPELPDFHVRITIDELLHHTSGLRDQWDLLGLAGYRYALDLINDADVMSLEVRQRELNFSPGSNYLYSNTGYTLAARIVKRVSGQSLPQFAAEHIFKPLGMNHTHIRDDHSEVTKGEALGYERGSDAAFHLSVPNLDTVGPTFVYTTIEDLAKWDENFYTGTVGGSDFRQKMTQIEPLTSGISNYARGLQLLKYRGLPIVEHGGIDAGYRAEFLQFPDQHFSVFTLCNTPTNPAVLSRRVADLYLAGRFPMATVQFHDNDSHILSLSLTEGKEGFYRLRGFGNGVVIQLRMREGHLEIADRPEIVDRDSWQPLRSDGVGNFFPSTGVEYWHFEPTEGPAQHLLIESEGRPASVWVHLPPYSPALREQQEFVGRYYSDELDTTYTVDVRAEALFLSRKKFPAHELISIAADQFASPLADNNPYQTLVEFARDANGRVDEMFVTTGRVSRLRFTRETASH